MKTELLKNKKTPICKHKWTTPNSREERVGSCGAYNFYQVVYTICEKCAEEKVIRRDYQGKNYV